MCGILGILDLDGRPVDPELAGVMLDAMTHRGPDDRGLLVEGPLALGHRRLSIIDLSERGRQPMTNEDGSVLIVYNGEVYNYVELKRELEAEHRFVSSSDTEVIIHAYEQWGLDCLERLNGMFAFLIWDRNRNRLIGARDPMGIKPFYYHWDGSRFMAASEIKALLHDPAAPRRVDKQAMAEYLTFQHALGDRTLFQGINKLEPGRVLVLDKSGLKIDRYWNPAWSGADESGEEELAERLKSLIEGAVARQLRSDVPVGCHLSGGVDSSLVASVAASLYPGKLKTFTGRFDEGSAYDESAWAEKTAARAGVEPLFFTPDLGEFTAVLPKLVEAMDEPAAGSGVFPQYCISRLAAGNVKVALGGQGGDELFGGYKRYRKAALSLLMHGGAGAELFRGKSNLGFLVESGPHFVWKSLLGRIRRRDRRPDMGHIYADLIGDLGGGELRALLGPDAGVRDPVEAFADRFNALEEPNPLNAVFRFDMENYLQALLHVEDRTSMMVSLESRVPLLDLEIVRFAAATPPEHKLHPRATKRLLREAGRSYLPPEVYSRRRKLGFPTPTEVWFRDPGFPLFDDFVFPRTARIRQALDLGPVELWRKATLNGSKQYNGRLWKILWLGIWFETFKVSV